MSAKRLVNCLDTSGISKEGLLVSTKIIEGPNLLTISDFGTVCEISSIVIVGIELEIGSSRKGCYNDIRNIREEVATLALFGAGVSGVVSISSVSSSDLLESPEGSVISSTIAFVFASLNANR